MSADRTQTFSRTRWLVLLAIAILIVIVVNPFSLFFLNDDFDSLPVYGQGEFIHKRGTRLFVELSLSLDFHLYGTQAWGYILTNLLIHISCCFAGLIWCKKMAKNFGTVLNNNFLLLGGILFMWFAFHSETVFWTISRTASLGLLCFFATWLCFFKTGDNKLWLAAGFVFMLCGLFSYETLMLVPLQIVLWHWLLPVASPQKKYTKWFLIVCLVAIAVYLPVRRHITLEWIGSYEAKEIYAFNLMSLAKNYGSLLLRTFVPPMQNKMLAAGIGGLFVLCTAIMATIIIRKRQGGKWWWFLMLNWLLSYVLFTSLGIDMGGYESERYLYVPSFFFSVWVMYSFSLLNTANAVKYIIAVCLIAYHAVFFVAALSQFRHAGQLAKTVIKTIADTPVGLGETTALENLPDKAFGIPLFRLGIKNGLKWLHPAYDTAKLAVASRLLNVKKATTNEALFKSGYDTITKTLTIKFFPNQKNDD